MMRHSDSFVGVILPFVVALAVVVLVLTSVGMLAFRKFHRAAKAMQALIALVAGYVVVLMAVSVLTPQKIGNAGQSYCVDIWCIDVENVNPMPARNEIAYKVDVRIFSDANSVKTSGKGFSLFMVDERGRQFPMLNDPSAIPLDVRLDPRQSVSTSLTFVAPADARELFLTVDRPLFWGARLCYACDGSLLHKPTLLRVL